MEQKLDLIDVRLHAIMYAAEAINALELRPLDSEILPPFSAGAHIDVHLPNGLVRQYSLANSQMERYRYVIGVLRERESRGGSIYIHEQLRVGAHLKISVPRNNFELVEDASNSLFIAGGIGITPLWCMVQRLAVLDRPWRLFYSARTRKRAAFLKELRALSKSGQLIENFDEEPGGTMLNLSSIVATASPDTHIYCCGPASMLKAFEAIMMDNDRSRMHLEYFAAQHVPGQASNAFSVTLRRSRKTIPVPAGKSILDTLLADGIACSYSCKEGYCGSCETVVLDGVPDHRDTILAASDRETNRTMMICVSRCKGDSLVLDL